MPRPPTRAPESSPAFPGRAAVERDALRALILPSQPPRPTRDGDLPTNADGRPSLSDRWSQRRIEIASGIDRVGDANYAQLTVRWEAFREESGNQYEALTIEGVHEFQCTAHGERMATFTPGAPHIIRGLATLLTELADRVDADRAAYALLEQLRR